MKNLSNFLKFDTNGFLHGKTFRFINVEAWEDFESHVNMGTKVYVVIDKDETEYSDGITGANLYEKITVKVPGVQPEHFKDFIADETHVIFKDIIKANVWGEYRNNLSIQCSQVVPVK